MLKLARILVVPTIALLALAITSGRATSQQPFYKQQFRQLDRQQNQQQRRPAPEEIERRREANKAANLAEKNRALELINEGRYAAAEALLKALLQRNVSQFGQQSRDLARSHQPGLPLQ